MAETRDQDGPDQDAQDQAARDAETAKLELPSFKGFGRKRRHKRAPAEAPEPTEAAAPEPTPEPVSNAEPEPEPEPVSEPVTRESESPATPRVETVSQDYTEPLMTDDQPTRVDAVLEPVDQPDRQHQLDRQHQNGHADHPSEHGTTAHPTLTAVPTQADEADPDHEESEPQHTTGRTTARTPLALPQVDGRVAAAVTGAVVGLVGCALTFLALTGCDAVRGTKTCGGGPGFVILLLILAGMVVLGALVLALWRQAEPRATSFLGVGVLFVVMLLVLQDQLLSPWMFLVVPVVTALGFVAGHWVTTAFVEKVPEKGPQHDVR